jgi:CheY-like chemotaxis protein
MSIAGTATTKRILLAEDDDANRQMLTLVLEKKGYTVTAVANGLEVLEAVDVEEYDVVLLDIMMPVLSGTEALKRLRPIRPDLPVIMLTAMAASEDVVVALGLGADDYVTKPYDFSVLHARIEARLRRVQTPTTAVTVTGPIEPGPGMVIDERYELIDQIGAGSFGVVYRARHRLLETEVAVKILRTGTGGGTELISPIDSMGRPQGKVLSADAAEGFRNEGVRACRVQHDNAVRIFDFGALPTGLPYLVMELLRGHSIEFEIQQQRQLSVERTVKVLTAVCACLTAAHDQHIVHRDVKPANVFVHHGVAGEVIKVVDFGVSKLVDQDAKATRDSIAGSPAYMAPERLRGRAYDGRSDVYAVGVMLYEMLTGLVPFRSDNPDAMAVALMQLKETAVPPTRLRSDLPALADVVVAELLEKDPTKRPYAKEAIHRLQDLLDA